MTHRASLLVKDQAAGCAAKTEEARCVVIPCRRSPKRLWRWYQTGRVSRDGDGILERNLVVEFLVEGGAAAKRSGAAKIAAASALVTRFSPASSGPAVEHG